MYTLFYKVNKIMLFPEFISNEITPGNNDYIQLSFDFDEDWKDLTKTIIIYRDGVDPISSLLDGDHYILPWETAEKPTELIFGLRGDDGNQRICTNTISIRIIPGIYKPGETPAPPPLDIYQQIIQKMGDNQTALDKATAQATEARKSATSAKLSADNATAAAAQTADDCRQTGADRAAVSSTLDAVKQEHAAVQSLAGQVHTDAEAVSTDRAAVAADKTSVDSAAADVTRLAGEANTAAEQVSTDRRVVEQISVDFVATANQATKQITDTGAAQVQSVTDTGDAQVQRVQDEGAVYRLDIDQIKDVDIPDLNAKVRALEGKTIKKYGVRFEGSGNPGTRLYDAAGLVAEVGTDTEWATNDFDYIDPWMTLSKTKSCGYFDANGKWVVNAYKGEPGYATDGSNGNVFAYIMPMYWIDNADKTTGGLAGVVAVSLYPQDGWNYWPGGWVACYEMGEDANGNPTSISGVLSTPHSLNSAIVSARKLGDDYTVTPTAEWDMIRILMTVEYATRNPQTVMYGAATLPYSESNTATAAETNVNRIITTNAIADRYVVGQTIGIGTTIGGEQIASNRVVTEIDAFDAENKAIYFDGAPVNIVVGNIVYSAAWITGSCDNVLTSSGSPVSNTSGKHPCTYRGIENPYGNALKWISDVLFKREGDAPYTYDIYHLPDPTQYQNGTITDDYVRINYQLPTANGYVKKLGFDSRYPHLRIPAEVGAGSTTYYADYYYAPEYVVCAAVIGGNWINGAYDGSCYWGCNYAPSIASVHRRARLSYFGQYRR